MKFVAKASRQKKVVVLLFDGTSMAGYVDPGSFGKPSAVEVLTAHGEHKSVNPEGIKSIHFVRSLDEPFEPEQKRFLSRPKLDGLWVRLRFRDEDVVEGVVSNDLLNLLDSGVQLTPADLHGNTTRMFIPRSALLEMKVLGVIGIARRAAKASGTKEATTSQTSLFGE